MVQSANPFLMVLDGNQHIKDNIYCVDNIYVVSHKSLLDGARWDSLFYSLLSLTASQSTTSTVFVITVILQLWFSFVMHHR